MRRATIGGTLLAAVTLAAGCAPHGVAAGEAPSGGSVALEGTACSWRIAGATLVLSGEAGVVARFEAQR